MGSHFRKQVRSVDVGEPIWMTQKERKQRKAWWFDVMINQMVNYISPTVDGEIYVWIINCLISENDVKFTLTLTESLGNVSHAKVVLSVDATLFKRVKFNQWIRTGTAQRSLWPYETLSLETPLCSVPSFSPLNARAPSSAFTAIFFWRVLLDPFSLPVLFC